jgi:hypothetical protein
MSARNRPPSKIGVTRVTGVTLQTNPLIIMNYLSVARYFHLEYPKCNDTKSCNRNIPESFLSAAALPNPRRWNSAAVSGRGAA